MPNYRAILLLIMLVQTCASSVLAQWTAQAINLRPGWNAVFLEVQPEPRDCQQIFASLPIESVWEWNRRFSPAQFIDDPNTLITGDPDWLVFLPNTDPGHAVMSLFQLQGGRPYLIKIRSNAAPFAWTVFGTPALRRIDWLSDSFNFVGFHLSGGSNPTFQGFFAGSPAHAAQPFYRLGTDGTWQRILNPATAMLQRGEGFWSYCRGQSTYQGPLEIIFEQGRGLDYGRILSEQTLRIRNRSANDRTVTIACRLSGTPPPGVYAALAGTIPFRYWQMDLASGQIGWVPLLDSLTNSIPAGGEWALRLEARRAEMVPFAGAVGSAGALYQALLSVADAHGSQYLVPATARGLTMAPPAPAGGALEAAGFAPPQTHPPAGLWVGSAVIRRVNQPGGSQPSTPLPIASEFQFRLLVHVDNAGQARLLQKVTQMWRNGTTTNNGNGLNLPDQPGRFVLLTDDSLIPQYSGATLRNGKPVGLRFSSAAFSFRQPIAMTGTFTGHLHCQVPLDYDDVLNPFKHRYHPDHNNLDERFAQRLPEGKESFNVNRQVELEFTTEDPDRLTLAGWGDDQLGGIYRETLTGLHRNVLFVDGTFRLHLASRTSVLNDGR